MCNKTKKEAKREFFESEEFLHADLFRQDEIITYMAENDCSTEEALDALGAWR